MQRRRFLGLGLASLASPALLRSLEARAEPEYIPPQPGPLVLSPARMAVLRALADTINPSFEAFPAASELLVPERIDALLAQAHPTIGEELSLGLGLVQSRLVGCRTRTFTALSTEARSAMWADWGKSPRALRQKLYRGFTALCTSTYWSSPELWSLVGYPGPPPRLPDPR